MEQSFKEKVEKSIGAPIPNHKWWPLIQQIVRDTLYGNVASALSMYLANGDESGITDDMADFLLAYYGEYGFKVAAGLNENY